jgi:Cu-Zn family superoxide dismutase
MPARHLTAALVLTLLAVPAGAQEEETRPEDQGATGPLLNIEGQELGNVSVATSPNGGTLVLGNAEGFPEGTYAVHLHQVGTCDTPDFESAGDHLGTGEAEHGILAESGPHPGDLPNVHVQPDGIMVFDAFAPLVSEEMLFDEDGTALIVHAGRDDYASQPGGDSGARIACAVLLPAPGTRADETVDAEATEEPADEGQATEEQPSEDQATEEPPAEEQ